MNRRDFLRKSAAGAGAFAVTTSLPLTEAQAGEKVKTPLEASGWVNEPARKIAVVDVADVVVVGGGPAGFAAAVAAARLGLDALLIERQYFLGGLFTGCGVTPVINMYSPLQNNGKEQAVKGLAQELIDRVEDVGMVSYERDIVPKVDPEAAKYFMEEMCEEARVRILYGVQVAQVVMSGDRIDSVIVEGKSGRVAIKSKFVVDCSGDGDILDWTGEDFNIYKEDIGAMWRIGNADASPRGTFTAVKGVYTRHMVGERQQDGLDMYNLSRIQLKLRKQMWDDAMDLRTNPGCQDLFLLDTPSVVGVRITRVLNSVCNVKALDAVGGKVYDDVIGYAGAESTVTIDKVKYPIRTRPIWQVPYTSLVPKTVKNLLVGGRCFGFERPLTYDSREVGTCFMTGQAAGTAAALAVLERTSNRELDIRLLQKTLREADVKLDR